MLVRAVLLFAIGAEAFTMGASHARAALPAARRVDVPVTAAFNLFAGKADEAPARGRGSKKVSKKFAKEANAPGSVSGLPAIGLLLAAPGGAATILAALVISGTGVLPDATPFEFLDGFYPPAVEKKKIKAAKEAEAAAEAKKAKEAAAKKEAEAKAKEEAEAKAKAEAEAAAKAAAPAAKAAKAAPVAKAAPPATAPAAKAAPPAAPPVAKAAPPAAAPAAKAAPPAAAPVAKAAPPAAAPAAKAPAPAAKKAGKSKAEFKLAEAPGKPFSGPKGNPGRVNRAAPKYEKERIGPPPKPQPVINPEYAGKKGFTARGEPNSPGAVAAYKAELARAEAKAAAAAAREELYQAELAKKTELEQAAAAKRLEREAARKAALEKSAADRAALEQASRDSYKAKKAEGLALR